MSRESLIHLVRESLEKVSIGDHEMIYGVPVVRWGDDEWEVCSFGGVPIGTDDAISSVLTFCAIRHGIEEQRQSFRRRYGA